MSAYHKIAAYFAVATAVMTEERTDVADLFDRAIDQFPELQEPAGPPPPVEPPDDGSDGDRGDSPWEQGRRREQAILAGIRQLAEQHDVGPLAPMRIDAAGNITMLQNMINSVTYERDEGLSDELRELARGYDPHYRGEVSGRWIKLNHFVWEKMLSDLGLMQTA